MSHPGDDFSWDIFSQGAKALVAHKPGDPAPLGPLRVARMIATGQSQSGSRLYTYIDNPEIHAKARVFDGFVPELYAASGLRVPPRTKVLWGNSETESTPGLSSSTGIGGPAKDGPNFVYWEVAGAVHAGWEIAVDVVEHTWHDDVAGAQAPGDLPSSTRQYGEDHGGPCPMQLFPRRYVARAEIVAMDRWLRTGHRPTAAPRFKRDPVTNQPVLDPVTHDVEGGLRLPPAAVPVATYTHECGLFGSTIKLDPVTLETLYPTHADYVKKFRAATEAAVAKGWLLPFDAAELLAQAEASDIGSLVP